MMRPIFGALSAEMAALRARYTPEQRAAIHAYLGETIEILRAQTRLVTASERKRGKALPALSSPWGEAGRGFGRWRQSPTP